MRRSESSEIESLSLVAGAGTPRRRPGTAKAAAGSSGGRSASEGRLRSARTTRLVDDAPKQMELAPNDGMTAGQLAALDQFSAASAGEEVLGGEAPPTAPPQWRPEAEAWTPRGHRSAVQAAAGAPRFSYIPVADEAGVASAAVELPAAYRAVRGGGCAVRLEAALDSEPAGRINAGEEVTVMERVELPIDRGEATVDDDTSTRATVVRLKTERGWVSELSKRLHPLMIPSPSQPPEAEIAALPGLKAEGAVGPNTLVWSAVMLGTFSGWQTLETCEEVLLVAAGVPCPPSTPFTAAAAAAATEAEPELERTASTAVREFTATTVSEDQVRAICSFASLRGLTFWTHFLWFRRRLTCCQRSSRSSINL